jgi:cytochrome c oxidase subunit 2
MYSNTGLEAANFVSSFNTSFYFILTVSLIFIVGLTGLMLYFVFKYNSKKHKKAEQIEGSITLEIVWTVVPIILAMIMFWIGWRGFVPMSKPPKDAMNVVSTARMWSFSFRYDNGKESPDLIVPVGVPVKVKLVSLDVLHSFYVPEFRIKSDMVPGREKFMWFRPEREGEYNLFCAEYCGLRHSYMNSKVQVLSKDKFDAWLNDTAMVAADTTGGAQPSGGAARGGTTAAKAVGGAAGGGAGEAIIKNNGCLACHSTDGSKIVGPTFKNLFGEQVTVTKDGKEVQETADEAYITRSVYEPDAEIVQGFQKGLMQSYKGTISEDDIAKIIEYLKTLK